MLVLSRGRNDKVVFPTLGISVEILRVAGSNVRLGIEAPTEIPVLRHELLKNSPAPQEPPLLFATRQKNHQIRNRLNAAALGLHMLHRQLEIGEPDEAEASIFKIFRELKSIEDELEESTPTTLNAPRQPGLDASPIARAALRALIVEDNDNERELLAGYLRLNGFEVDTAVDGLQAMVRLAEHAPPDVVLLDMKMPRFDGSKTVSAIRSNPELHCLKLFAVTGAEREDTNLTIGPEGVDRWFRKPINPQSLLDALREDLPANCLSA